MGKKYNFILNLGDPNNSNLSTLQSKSKNDDTDLQQKLKQAEMVRIENERLRSELNAHKKEITVLRGERDSLMNTISKLDIELTQAEQQRIAQQQPTGKK
jgi:chromosome segregation ATPase